MDNKQIITSNELFERTAPEADRYLEQLACRARTNFSEFVGVVLRAEGVPNRARKADIKLTRAVWELGRNHNLRLLVVSDDPAGASAFVQSLLSHTFVKAAFPSLRIDLPSRWSTAARDIQVHRDFVSSDPSICIREPGADNPGSRCDLILCDAPGDVHDIMKARLTRPRSRSKETI